MDLVQVAIAGVSAELKRNAEDQLLARLPQLPLGLRKSHWRAAARRRGRARCSPRSRLSYSIVLDNPYMTKRKS